MNLLTKEGRDIYMSRIREMWERQEKRCCLQGLVDGCPGKLALQDATFDHDEGRGMDGAHRDDRIWIPDAKTGELWPINGAAHALCNSKKGSVRKSLLLEMSLDVVP